MRRAAVPFDRLVLMGALLAIAGGAPVRLLAQQPTAVPVQDIRVTAFPGHMLQATLALPAAEAPYPAVVLAVPRALDRDGRAAAASLTAALVRAGWAVLRFETDPVADAGADAADDLYAIAQHLRDREDVDGDRVAVVALGSAAPAAVGAADGDEALRAVALVRAEPPSLARSRRAPELRLAEVPATRDWSRLIDFLAERLR